MEDMLVPNSDTASTLLDHTPAHAFLVSPETVSSVTIWTNVLGKMEVTIVVKMVIVRTMTEDLIVLAASVLRAMA